MRLACFALFLSSLFCSAYAENVSLTIPGSETIKLHSKQTKQDHELIIILPSSYESAPKRHYPTLYYLDAYWDFALVYSLYEQLRLDNLVPELILVGLSYPGSNEDYIRRRLSDFTPMKDPVAPGSGNANAFLSYLKHNVIKKIEAEYRADPKDRALAGHSLGGLFTLYAMYKEPEFFERYLAMSPTVIAGNHYVAKLDAQYKKKRKDLPARLFLAYGENEDPAYRGAIADYEKALSSRNYNALNYKHQVLPGMRHTSARAYGYLVGLPWLYSDIAPMHMRQDRGEGGSGDEK